MLYHMQCWYCIISHQIWTYYITCCIIFSRTNPRWDWHKIIHGGLPGRFCTTVCLAWKVKGAQPPMHHCLLHSVLGGPQKWPCKTATAYVLLKTETHFVVEKEGQNPPPVPCLFFTFFHFEFVQVSRVWMDTYLCATSPMQCERSLPFFSVKIPSPNHIISINKNLYTWATKKHSTTSHSTSCLTRIQFCWALTVITINQPGSVNYSLHKPPKKHHRIWARATGGSRGSDTFSRFPWRSGEITVLHLTVVWGWAFWDILQIDLAAESLFWTMPACCLALILPFLFQTLWK